MDLLFEVATPLGFSVRCSRAYWVHVLLAKHPVLEGREEAVEAALRDPDEVVLMKDASGRVIGVEILHHRPATADSRVSVETVTLGAA